MSEEIKIMLMALIDCHKDKKKIKKRIKEILNDERLRNYSHGGTLELG